MKKYLFRLGVALLAFTSGTAVFSGVRFLRRELQAPPPASKIKESFSGEEIVRLNSEITEQLKNIESETEAQTEPEDEWQWDGSGEFYLAAEVLPKGFKDFEFMEIITRDYEVQDETGAYGVPIPPQGFIQTKTKFKFVRIGIGNKQVSFETEKINGISYKFTGNYREENGDSCPIEENSVDLKGRLVKMKNGKEIAETSVGFHVSCGC